MGKKDTVLRSYLSNPEIFADLFNGYLYQGEQVLEKNDMESLDTSEAVLVQKKDGKTEPVQKYRDVIKKAAYGMEFIVLGVENQMSVHYAMPVRGMLYDALSYVEQVKEAERQHRKKKDLQGDAYLSGFGKNEKLLPALTLVVYYGTEEWDGKQSLHEMLDIGEKGKRLLKFLPDYRINLLKVNEIEDLEQYQTGLRELFGILRYRKNGDQLQRYMHRNQERLSNLDRETFQAIQALIDLNLNQEIQYENVQGGWNMCEAIQQLMKKSEATGFKNGEATGFKNGKDAGFKNGEINGILEIMKEYGSSKEKAVERLLLRYPNEENLIVQLAEQIFTAD